MNVVSFRALARNLGVVSILVIQIFTFNLSFLFLPPKLVSAQSSSKTTTRLSVPVSSTATVVITTTDNKTDKKILVTDHLSSTRVVLNEDGTKSSDLSYYPYGSSLNESQVVSTSFNDRYYTGQKKVSDSSPLYNYNARFYNPTIGVFTQPDTIEGPNRFAYVGGNPIMANDPTGNCIDGVSTAICIAVALAIGGTFAGMSTMPMSSAAAPPAGSPDPIGENYDAQDAEFSLSLWRMNPLVGFPVAANELSTGRALANGRELTRVDQVFNSAELAFGAVPVLNSTLGKANTAVQQYRIGRYVGANGITGMDIVNTGSDASAAFNLSEEALPDVWHHLVPLKSLDGAGGYYNSGANEIKIGFGNNYEFSAGIVQHEAVHGLQDLNGHPYFSQRTKLQGLDIENMAYSATNLSGRPFSSQMGGTLWSFSRAQGLSSSYIKPAIGVLNKIGDFHDGYYTLSGLTSLGRVDANLVQQVARDMRQRPE